MPAKEEMASIRYLAAYYSDEQWHFDYSLEDPLQIRKLKFLRISLWIRY